MEKQIALVNKTTKRVVNVLIVDTLDKDKNKSWETDELEVIAVKGNNAYLNGLWDGENFIAPTNDYLIEIGISSVKDLKKEAEAEAKETAKAAILDRIGLTADELKTILG